MKENLIMQLNARITMEKISLCSTEEMRAVAVQARIAHSLLRMEHLKF